MFQTATRQAQTGYQSGAEPRNLALDGFRGLMTVFVLVSHYFGEVKHGTPVLAVGWIAVVSFFVLSGFLVGRLILEKQDRANFFAVFYIRRACRTLPVYAVCVLVVYALLRMLAGASWLEGRVEFPLWSYLTFTQNALIAMTGSFGAHWLAPTWTLAVEEQFYLIAPALFYFVPRRILPHALVAGMLMSIGYRALAVQTGFVPEIAIAVLLPGVADTLIIGLLAAMAFKSSLVATKRFDLVLRLAPLVLIFMAIGPKLSPELHRQLFLTLVVPVTAIAAALLIMGLARGVPEAKRYGSRALCFFGRTSYSIYLTHLAVLGLIHGLILGSKPDVATPEQVLVTAAAVPLAVLVGWLGTVLVEQPITAYGRSWAWSRERRARQPQLPAASPARLDAALRYGYKRAITVNPSTPRTIRWPSSARSPSSSPTQPPAT
jgi:peptidoglycan/LPS O-acetylase OafA/YrhL